MIPLLMANSPRPPSPAAGHAGHCRSRLADQNRGHASSVGLLLQPLAFEEALIEMYLAGVPVRRVEDIMLDYTGMPSSAFVYS